MRGPLACHKVYLSAQLQINRVFLHEIISPWRLRPYFGQTKRLFGTNTRNANNQFAKPRFPIT